MKLHFAVLDFVSPIDSLRNYLVHKGNVFPSWEFQLSLFMESCGDGVRREQGETD